MPPTLPHLVCGAHNRFRPAFALWQNFVVPYQTHHHHCRFSTSPAELPSRKDDIRRRAFDDKFACFGLPREIVDECEALDRVSIRKVGLGAFKRIPKPQREFSPNISSRKLLVATKRALVSQGHYHGVAVMPKPRLWGIKARTLPWVLPRYDEDTPQVDRLTTEIESFHQFMQPDEDETVAREKVMNNVIKDVRRVSPESALELFGSERTGLAVATSDIDFRFTTPIQLEESMAAAAGPRPVGPEERNQLVNRMKDLQLQLFKETDAYTRPSFLYARYPLISMQDRKTGLTVQIVSSNDTSLARSLVIGYVGRYPYLKPVYTVLRTMFDIRGLSDVFYGGLGSYPLFMMLVASIRHSPHPRQDAGGALLNFLRYFGDQHNYLRHGLSIEPLEIFDKYKVPVLTDTALAKLNAGTVKPLPPFMLSLRDPADPTNDLGRKCLAIKHVKATCSVLHNSVHARLADREANSLLIDLVGPIFLTEKTWRSVLKNYGRRETMERSETLVSLAATLREAERRPSRHDSGRT